MSSRKYTLATYSRGINISYISLQASDVYWFIQRNTGTGTVSKMAEVCLMTQSERWQMQYEQVMAFIATNHRRPSKYYAEERLLWHWLRRNIKLMLKGDLPIERKDKFKALMALDEKYRRVNQFK